MIKSVIFF